jgi:hypothetical protein
MCIWSWYKPAHCAGCVLVGQEVLLTALVNEYVKINVRIDSILHALYRAGDCNGDGDLSLSEFTVVVRIADPTKSPRSVLGKVGHVGHIGHMGHMRW